MQEAPFKTGNASLAYALYAAGVPFPVDKTPVPFANIYDAERIAEISKRRREEGLRDYSGMTLEDAIKQAVEDGEKGDFAYCFQRTDELAHLIEVFDEQQRHIKESNQAAAEMLAGIARKFKDGDIELPEYMVRCACVMLRTRKLFLTEWRTMPPLVRVKNTGKSVTETNARGEKVVTHPGFRIMSLNASRETRERLRL